MEKYEWTKEGDNTEASAALIQKDVPLILITARPDWSEGSNAEMEKLNLTKADVVIAGAGTIIYWLNKESVLTIDPVFREKLQRHLITYKLGNKTEIYDPEAIKQYLTANLVGYDKDGLTNVKVDTNQGLGFTTLDIHAMPLAVFHKLIIKIRSLIWGVKVQFSEDLERISPDKFSGWIQVTPSLSGKDDSLRYVLETISNKINPYNLNDQANLKVHTVGDSAIDNWMIAMGTSNKDPYSVTGYSLGNRTPIAATVLEKVDTSLKKRPDIAGRLAHLQFISDSGPKGILSVINNL
jgi:hydroxymethylpyrimidine pyrophosphatase-like HAD family hydrolase